MAGLSRRTQESYMDNRSIPVLLVEQAVHRAKEAAEAANQATSRLLGKLHQGILTARNRLSTSSHPPEPPISVPQPGYPAELKRLLAIVAENPKDAQRLTPRRRCQMAAILGQLKAAIQVGSAENIAHLALSGAGLSTPSGLATLIPLFRQLERLGCEGRVAEAGPLAEQLAAEFARIERSLLQE